MSLNDTMVSAVNCALCGQLPEFCSVPYAEVMMTELGSFANINPAHPVFIYLHLCSHFLHNLQVPEHLGQTMQTD